LILILNDSDKYIASSIRMQVQLYKNFKL